THEQLVLRSGMKVDWDKTETDMEAWGAFIAYAGPGPFTILSLHLPPCTCRMSYDSTRIHAPGCPAATELNHYLAISRRNVQPIVAPRSDRLILINAKFFRVITA